MLHKASATDYSGDMRTLKCLAGNLKVIVNRSVSCLGEFIEAETNWKRLKGEWIDRKFKVLEEVWLSKRKDKLVIVEMCELDFFQVRDNWIYLNVHIFCFKSDSINL